ncbi:hypothetical protein EMIHUDRAFT_231191 [Emiliania huxleyi CCMP1516]|uniref:Glutamine amidotransferase type-2 domain-containing protein n=2 Tax=Emiliania huxleyi TaxID=2903 RepID=A0A0D3K857_EMIH1|nr:hypothetical protein EMIHUDRAFT_231191 [Emiliania huxleyi CCMP1516]EOD31942.1 hypothetical protein EMIHUDRAFT_231191 [Emiliania huxleyi CCMP1516]|eukprot:XP_005784371.1 hypothetical protein EMIHUDRAFT_231191 [Emiliania huxleyi CCMP1516]
MCRWVVFVSRDPVTLADLLVKPQNSLVRQSFDAKYHPGFTSVNNALLNGDGTGLAWYVFGKPYLYKSNGAPTALSPLPPHLRAFCRRTMSRRGALPDSRTNTSRADCHPFRFGRLTFMHNGHIEGFASFKRAMVNLLTQEAYLNVTGVTDTEHAFALLLSQLRDPGRSSSFSREELEDALDEMIRIVAKLQAAAGVTGGFTTLNLALSDGETLVATRYCDKWPETPPPSLYFCYDRSETLRAALHQQTGGSGGPGDGSKNAGGGDKEAAALLDDQAMRPSGESVHSVEDRRYPLPANSMLSHTRSTGSTDQRSRPRLKAIEIPDTSVRSPQVVEGWAMRPRADTASSVGSLGSPTLRD